MKNQFFSDENLVNAILGGKKKAEEALRWLVQHEALNQLVLKSTQEMGGTPKDANSLFDDTLIELIRDIQSLQYPDEKRNIQEYLLEGIKNSWLERLSQEAELRKSVLAYIAADEALKERLIKAVNYKEDYYNQGFLKMDEIFIHKKYNGNDIKGYFYKVCKNLKRNTDRIKTPESSENIEAYLPPDNTTEYTIRENELKACLNSWLSQLSNKCKEILSLKKEGYTIEEIMNALNFKSKKETSLKLFRCKEKLISLVDFQLWQKTEKG